MMSDQYEGAMCDETSDTQEELQGHNQKGHAQQM